MPGSPNWPGRRLAAASDNDVGDDGEVTRLHVLNADPVGQVDDHQGVQDVSGDRRPGQQAQSQPGPPGDQ